MTTLAFDTATSRCTVAAEAGGRSAHRFVDGARLHAGRILPLIDDVLRALGVSAPSITRIVTADGPGSFTGLRVGAAVAKALLWYQEVQWLVAPSLLVRALPHAPAGGGIVLALSDALRGEVYAGCWRIEPGAITAIGGPPRAMAPGALGGFGRADVVVAGVPEPLAAAVASATGIAPITGEAALPDARQLIALTAIPGGTTAITAPSAWEPDYGRPAEAQAIWERKHGRALPTSAG